MVRFGPAIDPPTEGGEPSLLRGDEADNSDGTDVSLDELLVEIGVEDQ